MFSQVLCLNLGLVDKHDTVMYTWLCTCKHHIVLVCTQGPGVHEKIWIPNKIKRIWVRVVTDVITNGSHAAQNNDTMTCFFAKINKKKSKLKNKNLILPHRTFGGLLANHYFTFNVWIKAKAALVLSQYWYSQVEFFTCNSLSKHTSSRTRSPTETPVKKNWWGAAKTDRRPALLAAFKVALLFLFDKFHSHSNRLVIWQRN